jgi:hypothetical protein
MLLRQVYIKWNWIRFFTGNDFKFMSSIDKETTGTPSSSSVNQRTTRGLIHRATNDGPAIAYAEQVVINVSYNYPPPSNVDHGASLNGGSLQRLSYFFFQIQNSNLQALKSHLKPYAMRQFRNLNLLKTEHAHLHTIGQVRHREPVLNLVGSDS